MAKLYGLNNAVDFSAKNLINFTSIFARSAGQPLDKTALWYPAYVDAEWNVVAADAEGAVYKTGYERAAQYAATSAAYVGQELAVIDVTYGEDSETVVSSVVTIYCIQDNSGTLQEVGKATSGDGKSITLSEDGILSISGFEAAHNATLPQKSPVYVKDTEGNDTEVIDHYEIRWVAIDAIVEGDTNTKSIVAAGDNETHIRIETSRDDSNDTNTYKISIDLSEYATSLDVGAAIKDAKDELSGTIAEAKDELEGTISEVEEKFDTTIGVASSPAVGEEGADDYKPAVEATGLFAAIEAAEARAKAYADANDADTAYDDTEVQRAITSHGSRLDSVETAIGDESKGLTKAIADEAKARENADATTLNSAKSYTDEEIVGLDITIEKKVVGETESDYIVIKNKTGTEVASVNAAKFVKDGMLDSADYSTETKILTLTWNTDAGKNATEIDLNDLVNTYTGSDSIQVGTDGQISVKADYVALQSDLENLEGAISNELATKRTEEQVNAQIDAKLVAVDAAIATKADTTTVNAAIDLKADKTALESAVEALETTIAEKADATETQNAIDAKVAKSDYEADKATFALKESVRADLDTIGTAINRIDTTITNNAAIVTEHVAAAEATYATKTELKTTDDKAVSNASAIENLSGRLDGIVAQGGEPNVINNIKVNGVVQTIASDKSVDINVPVISNVKVSELSDGQSVVNRLATAESSIESLNTAVGANQTNISNLNSSITALATTVNTTVEGRLSALEGTASSLNTSVTANTADIKELKDKDAAQAVLIQANTDKFGNYYDKTTIDTKVATLEDAIENVDLSSRVDTTTFENWTTYVSTELGKKAVAADVEASINGLTTEVAKKANSTDVYSKTDADAKFMTEAQVKSTVDTVIADAVDSDTLEGLAQLVEYAHANAGNIAKLVQDVENNGKAIAANTSAIQINAAAIEANTTAIESLTVGLTTGIAGATVHSSNEIEVVERAGENETGVELSVKEVDVSKLVQSAGYVLVLNGGSATV